MKPQHHFASLGYELDLSDMRSTSFDVYERYPGAGNFDEADFALRRAEQKLVEDFCFVIEVVQNILRTSGDLFELRRGQCGPTPLAPVPGMPGRKLVKALDRFFTTRLLEYIPYHASNPYLDLLLQAIDKHPRVATGAGHWFDLVGGSAIALKDALNGLVDTIRSLALRPEWRTDVDSALRRRRDNYSSFSEYFAAVFAYHARWLVVRLDLAYGADFSRGDGHVNHVDVSRARDDMARFIRLLRTLHPVMEYGSRLEYGLLTGYHYHLVVLLDGDEHWCDVLIGKQFGELWANVITEGRGRYFNCNAVDYRYPAVGLIRHCDEWKRANFMRYVVTYLTKLDLWLEHDRTGKFFFRGQMPRAHSGLGRPRQSEVTAI